MNSTSSSTPLDGLIFGVCAVLGAVVTAACLYRARTTPTVANRCITTAFGICTVGVAFAIPAVASWAEELTGVDNVAKLIAHICAILWCASLQLTMVDIAYDPEYLRTAIYQRATVASIVLLVMIPLWLKANTPGVEFTTAFAANVPVRVYLLVYLGYVFLTCCELAFMCGKSATLNWPERPWSSFGYGSSAAAAVAGIGYTASKGGYLLAYTAGSPWSLGVEERLSPSLSGIAIVFLFIGLTLPVFGLAFRKVRRRLSRA
ncbi:hypothetical protein AR457_40120 [Streptomyces agglomeratus]|uniref:hypothetical protein n=1 Tax=Streptomyces agglomeratus TaxID=285458 RepID=UPI0008524A18|nr:hypothetical protein [Streptomyces agglomeratus]OEJ22097.1 hypothetical protein AR457_40120 [Streptomyces agglomeratus]OEJ36934.1 hypothetical protein BGK70_00775 [Streptomyces agglomeratus]